MKKTLCKILMGITALGLFFAQYACGGSGAKTASGNYMAEDFDEEEGYYYEETAAAYAREDAEYPEEAEYAFSNKNSSGDFYEEEPTEDPTVEPTDPVGAIDPSVLDEKLVYTCSMDMETTEYEKTMASIRELIQKYNAIIGYESYSDSASNWYYSNYEKRSGTLSAYLVIRVPSKSYRDFLSGMEGYGKITRSEQNVENITRKYSETQTTIRSLETQENRLLEMMENAETIEEMLAIEDRLSEVQNELQLLKNRLSEMDTDVAYSTINLNIREVIEYTVDPDPVHTLTFGDRLKNTLRNSWNNFTGFLEGFLFFLIEALPILLVIGGISVGIMFIIMGIVKSAKKRNARRAAKANAPAAPAAPRESIPVPEKKE